MRFLDYFSHIYVINLPSRKDRYRRIIWQLKEAGIWSRKKVSVFEAIIGRTCFLSHLAVLKLAREARLDNVLIIEDDLVISNLFRANEESLVSQLKGTKWDFIYFGHQLKSSASFPAKLVPAYNEIQSPSPTNHFYAVNSSIFDRFITFLEQIKKTESLEENKIIYLDAAYAYFREQNKDIITLIAAPSLGTQGSSKSDLHSTRWFDRVPIFHNIAGLVRELRVFIKFWLAKHMGKI